jgi:hypothetical protein
MPDTATPAPIAPQVDPKLAMALSAFGPWGIVAGLVLSVGLPFVDHLIANAHNNVPVTPDEWAALRAKAGKSWDEL